MSRRVEEYNNQNMNKVSEDGNRLVVRNGRCRPRKVTIGSGTIEVSASSS